MARVQIDIAAERISDPPRWARIVTVALDGDARYDTQKNLIAACETGWLTKAKKIGQFYVDIPLGKHIFAVSVSGSPHTLEGQAYTGIWKATITLLRLGRFNLVQEIGKIDFEGTRAEQAQVELTIP